MDAKQRDRVFALVAGACGAAALAIAGVVWLGWLTQMRALVSVMHDWATMKPNTATALVLLAMGVLLHALAGRGQAAWQIWWTRLAIGASCGALLIGAYSVAANIGGWSSRVDSFALEMIGYDGDEIPGFPEGGGGAGRLGGRMSNATAVALIALGLGLVGLGQKSAKKGSRFHWHEACLVVAMTIGLLALMGYAFDAKLLYQFKPFVTISFPTCLSVLLVAVGTFSLRPDGGAMSILTSDLPGGVFARRTLAAALLLPVVGVLALIVGTRLKYLEPEFGIMLLATMTSLGFAIVGMATARALNRAEAARATVDRARTSLMNELDHRVKNNLAAMLALADLTSREAESLDEFRSTFLGRVRAMAQAHEALAASRWEGVRLGRILDLMVSEMVDDPARVALSGKDVMLPARVSQALCAAIYELATNALKYGALSGRGGRLTIEHEVDMQDVLHVRWTERCNEEIFISPVDGFGIHFIRGSITHELQGDLKMGFEPQGLRCEMRIPLEPHRKGCADTQTFARSPR